MCRGRDRGSEEEVGDEEVDVDRSIEEVDIYHFLLLSLLSFSFLAVSWLLWQARLAVAYACVAVVDIVVACWLCRFKLALFSPLAAACLVSTGCNTGCIRSVYVK